MLHNIWIVSRSEFLRRVRGKWFLIGTLLAPLAMLIFFAVVVGGGVLRPNSDRTRIAVVDESGALYNWLVADASESLQLDGTTMSPDSLRAAVEAGRYDGYLVLPASLLDGAGEATYYSSQGGGLSLRESLGRRLREAVRQARLERANVSPEVTEILTADTRLRSIRLTEAGEEADSAVGNAAVGYAMGFIIYIAMLIYGSVVMQGVLEEKQNRVVEVMVSAVRPFDLLMGKVLGIGAMGLVQLLLWALIGMGALALVGTGIGMFVDPSALNLPAEASSQEIMEGMDLALPTIPFSLVFWFLLFFLGGYLLYASLFAAVGSAVEQAQDAQSLTFPLMMPIILSFIFLTMVLDRPNSPLAIVLSLIPFCSPLIVPVRLAATDVPLWQTVLSFLLLMGGFVGAVWVSARIYRIGILSYGKKPTLKDLARWLRYS